MAHDTTDENEFLLSFSLICKASDCTAFSVEFVLIVLACIHVSLCVFISVDILTSSA